MDDLDRIRWEYYRAFTLYGARIGIRSNRGLALRRLTPVLPPMWRPYAGTDVDRLYSLWCEPRAHSRRKPRYSLYNDQERLVERRELDAILTTFDRDVQLAVALEARDKVFVHAGVVGWRGRAIVIPGKTYTGKSTLVRELVRKGAIYYSDEYAVLDSRGWVHPFARPLALRDKRHVNRKLSFEELGGTIGKHPLKVGTVLVTRYRDGTVWRPRALSPGRGVLELLANTVTARTQQGRVLETLAAVTSSAQILKGARGDAATFAARVLERLG